MQQQTYFLLRRLALFIILMNIFLNSSYAENTRQRSINNKAEIQGIKKENEVLRLYIDSISNNISKQEIQISNIITEYKIDQSYFDTAIKMQTGIYSSIIGAVFFLLGVYSFFTYKNALEKVETSTDDKLQRQKTVIDNSLENLKKKIETQLSEQKTAIEDSQQILNDIIEKQIEKQNTTFERVKTQMHNTIEKQFSGQKSKFEILKKEIELDSQSSLSKEIAIHEQAFQKLIGETSINITKQIEKQKAEFEGVKSNMETKVGFLLGSQIENFKEQKEKIDANLDKELSRQRNDFNEFKKEMKGVQLEALRTSGNSYTSISLSYYENRDWLNAFDFNLSALVSRKRMYIILSKTPPIDEQTMNTIHYSLQQLTEISTKLEPHEKLKKCKDYFLKQLDEAYEIENTEIRNSIAQIRTTLISIYSEEENI